MKLTKGEKISATKELKHGRKYNVIWRKDQRKYYAERARVSRQEDPDKYKDVDKKWHKKYWEKRNAYSRQYYQLHREELIEANSKRSAKYYQRNKDKHRARSRLGKAVRAGIIKRGVRCENCGSIENISAHHDDYNKPLIVRWLCRKCHARTHYPKPPSHI